MPKQQIPTEPTESGRSSTVLQMRNGSGGVDDDAA